MVTCWPEVILVHFKTWIEKFQDSCVCKFISLLAGILYSDWWTHSDYSQDCKESEKRGYILCA